MGTKIKQLKNVLSRQKALAQLKPEPSHNCGLPLITLRFRAPGSQLQRRFLGSETLSTLLMFLRSEGFRPEEYKVITSFPRRDISSLDKTASLESLKLCPQETLTLEAIHQGEDSEDE